MGLGVVRYFVATVGPLMHSKASIDMSACLSPMKAWSRFRRYVHYVWAKLGLRSVRT
jgi:hypothetical protein